MRSKSIYAMAFGFGILVILIGLLGFGAVRRAKTIYREMDTAQEAYLQAESFRRDVVADMYLADILVRDYLLDPSPQNTISHREQLLAIRSSLQERMDNLSAFTGQEDPPRLQRLRDEVQGYWDSLDPIFDWTNTDKAKQSWMFLRKKVFPRRQAVVNLAHEIALANRDNLEHEQERIRNSQRSFRRFLLRMMSFSLVLGAVVAAVTTLRVARLEKQHNEQRTLIIQAESDLRRLSRRLVQMQESERKSLSRELHDEVGQKLTALGLELAHVQKTVALFGKPVQDRLDEARRLNGDAIHLIRNLAMGLRPSMLDDLGLQPALEWQGREFARRTGVPATVHVEGELDRLDDAQRTCIYRLVQEALTNCARHASAKNVEVNVMEEANHVSIEVKDDGIGFSSETAAVRTGLGLLGMRERVEAAGGKLQIQSTIGSGTTVSASIPKEGMRGDA